MRMLHPANALGDLNVSSHGLASGTLPALAARPSMH